MNEEGTPAIQHITSQFNSWIKSKMQTVAAVLQRSLIVSLVVSSILWLSILIYISFLHIYLPDAVLTRPVHFQFRRGDCGVSRDKFCSFPTANVSLRDRPQLLMGGQVYQIDLILDMPESPVNKDLGVFMAKLTFTNKENIIIATSSRPAMLRHKSRLLHFFSTTFFAVPLVTGFSEEKQHITTTLFEGFIEDSLQPAAFAQVELQALNIELYSAFLIINARFTGLRYFMYHWPLTAGILGILGNFAMISLLIIIFRHSLFDAGQQSHILIQVSESNLSNVERMVTDFNRSYLPIFRDAGSECYGNVGNVIVNASNVGLIPAVRLVSLSTRDIQTVFRTIDQPSSINRNSEENDMESISSTGNIYGNPSISGDDDIENFNGIQNASTVDNDTDQDGNISVERNGDGNGIDREQQISGLYHQIDVPETGVSGSVSVGNEEFILRQRRTNESSLSSDTVESTKK